MTANDRAAEMLRIAAQYIREADHEDYTIFYDDAVCDGWCIADDCEGAAEAIAALTDPAPAKQVTVSEAEAIREAALREAAEVAKSWYRQWAMYSGGNEPTRDDRAGGITSGRLQGAETIAAGILAMIGEKPHEQRE